ncbi:MAG: MFS transporter [Deltaproteobacteria bacterium]|nr:MFS transporter [Deltaproteobacteria bacterium]
MPEAKSTWRFPAAFWTANVIELFERAAYYGTFITLALFLTRTVGYGDIWANSIAGIFAAFLYLMPFFNGAAADRLGFRRSLILAFALLAAGYATLGLFPHKVTVLFSLLLVMMGGAFVKPIITGTVAKTSDESNRARAYSLFYMMVNIGAFSGKTVAKPVRVALGLDYVPLYSAGAAVVGLILVSLFYWPKRDVVAPSEGATQDHRGAQDALRDLLTVLRNGRFTALILITAAFWAIQGQLYASMPKYVLRMVGEHASPEWYANINPAVVVLLVVPITQLVRRLEAITSIGIGLGLIPFSALLMALSPQLSTDLTLFGYQLHPITVMMVAGIGLQGVAECFLSPRYLEYCSRQAPPGQEGLYMGFSHVNTFFAWLFGFVLSGFLLEAYCPEPKTLSLAEQAAWTVALKGQGAMPEAYAHAHYIWYVFAFIGFVGFAALLVFQFVTKRADARKRLRS